MKVLVADVLHQPPGRRGFRDIAASVAVTLVAIAYATLAAEVLDVSTPAAVGIFAAATISGIAGFAFSALCAPLLAQLGMDPVRMVLTMALCSIAIQAWSVWVLRRQLDLAQLLPLPVGGLCTLPIGVTLLTLLPTAVYAVPVGALLVGYGVWALLRPPLKLCRLPGWTTNALVGATGGITAGLAAFPGAVVAVWCGLQGWPKERQRAVTPTYILVMQISLLAVIAVMVPRIDRVALADLNILAYVPPALMGAACGLRFFRGLTDRQFGRAVNCLLIAAGLGMVM